MTWETTEDVKVKINNQPDFALVAFSGAGHSQELVNLASDQAREAALRNQLASVYPGFDAQIKKGEIHGLARQTLHSGFLLFPGSGRSHRLGPLLEKLAI